MSEIRRFDFKDQDIESLLETYYDAEETCRDYVMRADYLDWSQEAEDHAYDFKWRVIREIKRRCGEEV